MRLVGLSLGLVASCTAPNPAFFATQAGSEGSVSASGQTAGDATLDPTGGTTRDPATGTTTASTSVTDGTTGPVASSTTTAMTATATDPGTDATSLPQTSTDSTTTGDPDTTSTGSTDTGNFMPLPDLGMMNVCPNYAAPDLKLAVQHAPPPQTCDFASLSFPVVVTGKADADSLQLRQCKNYSDCVLGDTQCLADQTFTVHINGPLALVPKVDVGTCLYFQYHGDGQLDPNTCLARAVRLARVEPALAPVSIFVAGVELPDTLVLPPPWNDWLEFDVKAEHLQFCGDGPDPICGQMRGEHAYLVDFGGMEIDVPPMSSKAGMVPVYDDKNKKVADLPGAVYNLRSWAHPADACEFKWIWLADDHKSP